MLMMHIVRIQALCFQKLGIAITQLKQRLVIQALFQATQAHLWIIGVIRDHKWIMFIELIVRGWTLLFEEILIKSKIYGMKLCLLEVILI
jgi:hypothetical protein